MKLRGDADKLDLHSACFNKDTTAQCCHPRTTSTLNELKELRVFPAGVDGSNINLTVYGLFLQHFRDKSHNNKNEN